MILWTLLHCVARTLVNIIYNYFAIVKRNSAVAEEQCDTMSVQIFELLHTCTKNSFGKACSRRINIRYIDTIYIPYVYSPTADGGLMGRALDLRSTGRGFKSYSRQKLRNNLGQVVHTYVPLSPSSTTWYHRTSQLAVMLCGWEGNRRPGGK